MGNIKQIQWYFHRLFVSYWFACTFSVLLSFCLHILVSVFCRVCVSFSFFFERERAWNWADGGVEELEEGKSMLRIYYTQNFFFQLKREKQKRSKKRKATNLRVKKQTKGKECLLSERYFLVAVSINNVNYC